VEVVMDAVSGEATRYVRDGDGVRVKKIGAFGQMVQ
jgi:hypothetical protein